MLLYYGVLFGIDTRFWGRVLLLVAAVLTVWSMFYYLRKAWPLIKENTSVKKVTDSKVKVSVLKNI